MKKRISFIIFSVIIISLFMFLFVNSTTYTEGNNETAYSNSAQGDSYDLTITFYANETGYLKAIFLYMGGGTANSNYSFDINQSGVNLVHEVEVLGIANTYRYVNFTYSGNYSNNPINGSAEFTLDMHRMSGDSVISRGTSSYSGTYFSWTGQTQIPHKYSGVTFTYTQLIESSNINITLNSPENNYATTDNEINFNASYEGANNVSNSTLYVWYSNDTLHKTNFTDLSSPQTNSTSIVSKITGFLLGYSYKWNYYFCDITGICDWATGNYTLTRGSKITTFNNSLTSENLTFAGNNNTRYLRIPKSANVTGAYMNLSGMNSESETIYLYASDDSYVDDGAPTSNYGSGNNIVVGDDGTYAQRGFVKFSNIAINSSQIITDVTYRILAYKTTESSVDIGAYFVSDDGWDETTITWNNQPSYTTLLDTDTISTGGIGGLSWHYFNVTQQTKIENSGDGNLSMALISSNAGENNIWVLSKEMMESYQRLQIDYENQLTNPTITLNNTNIWNYSGTFNQANNKTDNFNGTIQGVLDGQCTCTGCVIDGFYCNIPFNFNSDTSGKLEYSDINILYYTSGFVLDLLTPSNNSWVTATQNFSCSQSDSALGFINSTLYIWNSTGDVYYQNTTDITGESNYTSWNVDFTYGDNMTWNCLVFDSSSQQWNPTNYTFETDPTIPSVSIDSITTTAGSQTISYNSSASDTYLNSCFYSIYDSVGAVDGLNNNVSISCNSNPHSATVTAYGTYTLTIYANDLAGNENQSSLNFTTSPSSGGTTGGGGGGGSGENTIPAAAIIQPEGDPDFYSNLSRAIWFARIYDACDSKLKNCFLDSVQKNELIDALFNQEVFTDITIVDYWLKNYNDGKIDSVIVTLSDSENYKLVVSGVSILPTFLNIISPQNPDKIFLAFFTDFTFFNVIPNKELKNCTIISGDVGFSCEAKGSFATLNFAIPEGSTFTSKLFQAEVSFLSTGEPAEVISKVFTVRTIRPTLQLIISILFLAGGGIFVYKKRKSISKIFKKRKKKK